MKIKEFCKKYKTELLITGVFIAGAITAAVVTTSIQKVTKVSEYAGKSVISWTPDHRCGAMSGERVKQLIDLNADQVSNFAVVKEGKDAYTFLTLGSKIVDA